YVTEYQKRNESGAEGKSRDKAIRRKAVKKERSIAPKFPGACTRKANAAASGSQRICRGERRVETEQIEGFDNAEERIMTKDQIMLSILILAE
ncbi:hypothetical protein, partial [Stomatobaculum longum]|uniref:hypothetical protein n=1 Tax=Stomatobaculum longum TaxID=796942 RepID=UPI0028DB7FD6